MSQEHLGFEIRKLSNLINRRINRMIAEEEDTLTAHQAWVLKYLQDHRDLDIMQRDLEKQFQIRRSTTSHMLQLMEKNGYIQRIPVPEDARLKRIVITDKGQEAYCRMIDRLNRFEATMQSGLEPAELEQLLSVMHRLEHNIR